MPLPLIFDRISKHIGTKTYVVLGVMVAFSLWYFESQIPPLTEADRLRIGCQNIHAQYDNTPIAQLTMKQIDLLNACKSQGL